MREDVLNEIEFLGEEVMKMVNKSELSRRLNCDRPVSYTHLTLPTIYSV